MKAEIISSGTELLLGSIVNTNARYLSQKLAENAIDVHFQTTVGDNIDRLVQAFKTACERADIVICGGGLGPTEDDVTAEALARFIDRPLLPHPATHSFVIKQLKRRGFRMNRLIAKQCRVPSGAQVIQNEEGTAPGILCETVYEGKKKWLLLLPGPPRELEPMFSKKALPLLLKMTGLQPEFFILRKVKIAGKVESEVAQKTTDLLKLKPPLTVGIYARPGEVELKIMAKAVSRKKAEAMTAKIEKEIRRRFGNQVYGIDEESLASVVGTLLRKKKKTLATAESCTAGLLSALVADVPGSSDYFLGGVITYSNRLKTELLGISPDLLKTHGAVSRAVAGAMAKSAQHNLGSDFALAITGIAGPGGGSAQKPVGLVHIALATPKSIRCFQYRFFGNRSEIRSRAALEALNFLRLNIAN